MTTPVYRLSSWGELVMRYPDREETQIKLFKDVSAAAGGMSTGAMKIAVCANGLRIGVSRVVGPYFFVPWRDIQVVRRPGPWPTVELQFGDPPTGGLKMDAFVANRLARAAPPGAWPEASLPRYDVRTAWALALLEWLIGSTVLSLFLTLVPRLAEGFSSRPLAPILVTILSSIILTGALAAWRLADRLRD